jgi:nucleoside-diphosphate-sugar epimerase
MRVVVVGGTGNISTGVVKALLTWGHEVTVFNRGRRRSRLPDGVRYLQGDRKERAAFEERMQAERFDAAIDMICFNAEDAQSDVKAFRGVKHFIQTSTVATFGGPLSDMPTDESSPLHPVTDYGRNKVAADEVFMAAHRQGDLPVTILKPGLTWGPGGVIARQLSFDRRWLDRVRRGKPILVTHGGDLFYIWCHSDDAGVAYAAALGRTACLGQIYILTSPGYRTWRQYHEGVAAGMGRQIELVDAPAELLIKIWPQNTGLLASESRWNRLFSVAKLQYDIPEFQPRITLEDGIAECVAWLDQEGLIEDSRTDDTEDRIVSGIARLYRELSAAE